MLTSNALGAAAVAVLAMAAGASAKDHCSPAPPGSHDSIKNMKDKIKTVVILVMENRSVDNILGGQRLKGLDNPINNGPFCNSLNISTPHAGEYCSKPLDFDSILDDPDHSIYGNNLEFYGSFTPDNDAIQDGSLLPEMDGFLTEQIRLYGSEDSVKDLSKMVLNYYTEAQIPVITTLSHNFLVFNDWFGDIPGPTNPNRLAMTSGTSGGKGTNNFDSYTIHQRSIFQEVTELGMRWKNYRDENAKEDEIRQDAGWFAWTAQNNKTGQIASIDSFYKDAAAGTLPELTYINPSCCGVGTSSMHPTGLISDGEQFIKDIYEALRSSPQWEETLWVLTFDESGGFHDHVPPPLAVRPDNFTYTETTPSGEDYTFEFDRLGGRLPTWLISPWVSPRVEGMGVNSNKEESVYMSTSVLRTLGYLWDFAPYNPRVESAPSFDHLINREIRHDCPEKLPPAYPFRK